jgi:hypothetical protein
MSAPQHSVGSHLTPTSMDLSLGQCLWQGCARSPRAMAWLLDSDAVEGVETSLTRLTTNNATHGCCTVWRRASRPMKAGLPAIGADDGDGLGRRYLIGGIVATFTRLSPRCSRGNPRFGSSGSDDDVTSGVALPLGALSWNM